MAVPGPRPEDWLRQMLLIRLFEDKVQELFLQGLVQGTTHLCQGQEAVSVGVMAALASDDYLTVTYRGHGHALARGMDPEVAFAELMGRATGCCGGVGGSMHLADASRGLLGSFAIVAAGLPVALGAAMSARLRESGQIAVAFCGDGATNIGTFHESLNMAAVWRAPVVFVIENNLYGEYSPLRETTAIEDLAARAAAYGMPGRVVDGQDVDSTYAAAQEAAARARGGDGPTLLEMKTYRYRGHSRTDPARYRAPGELEAWKARDPIEILGARLAAAGALSQSAQGALRNEIQQAIDDAAARAATARFPTLDEARRHVHAG